MDTELVTEQFEVSQRRVQQLVEEYRDSSEIPQLETPGRKPYEEYPNDLEQRTLELRLRLSAGADAIAHILGFEMTFRSTTIASTPLRRPNT